MNRMFAAACLLLAAFLQPLSVQDALVIDGRRCPMEGSARTAETKAENRLKNRYSIPADGDINRGITLQAMLRPGTDRDRWSNKDAAEITGFVVNVTGSGAETCNCKSATARFTDTHIDLVSDPADAAQTRKVIVEVTPRLRAAILRQGDDWSTQALRKALRNRWVKFRGWMFFDAFHADEAENTAPGRRGNWRATAWELHPVTFIEVLPERPR